MRALFLVGVIGVAGCADAADAPPQPPRVPEVQPTAAPRAEVPHDQALACRQKNCWNRGTHCFDNCRKYEHLRGPEHYDPCRERCRETYELDLCETLCSRQRFAFVDSPPAARASCVDELRACRKGCAERAISCEAHCLGRFRQCDL